MAPARGSREAQKASLNSYASGARPGAAAGFVFFVVKGISRTGSYRENA